MSNWNTDMDRAPKGKTATVSRLVNDKDSASGKSLKSFDEYQTDDVILMSECGKVIKSYWLPKENRWAGFSINSRPLAWLHWPVWSEEVASHVEAQRKVSA